ncbi:hypothetical protein CIT26_30760 [Mesorhizobium temperatum]|uniref:Uncharacterized protein n=1 Tax=Mesorhizobium temperatum TaxID=241416 RepID=A0A271LDT3_9HYPH|nr:hypothetical protein CIT26_30760 [Mesorhizobium temperatum]
MKIGDALRHHILASMREQLFEVMPTKQQHSTAFFEAFSESRSTLATRAILARFVFRDLTKMRGIQSNEFRPN